MHLTALNIHEGRKDARPEDVGLDPDRLRLLDDLIARLIKEEKLQAGSYLIARHGKIVAHRAMGRLTYEADSPDLMTNSIRRIASITKVVTAVAIMKLVELGKLYLTQPVAHWIHEFDTDMHRKITIWHLLTHSSGLNGDPGQNMEKYAKPWYGWWASERKKSESDWKPDDWIKVVLSGPVRAEPGKLCIYNTAGFALLAEVIKRASGMTNEEFIHQHIIGPLGMERTFFQVPEHLRSETCYTNEWDKGDIFEATDREGMPPKGGHGMYSTLEDLWKFGQAMLDGGTFNGYQLLGRRTVELMVSDQLQGVKSNSWGQEGAQARFAIGWALEYDDICTIGTFSHEGAGRCCLFVDPVEELVFVCITPTKIDWVAESVVNPRAIVWSSIL